MSWIAISTTAGFVGAAATGLYLLVQREKSSLHWHLVAVMFAISLWTGGALLRLHAQTGSELHAALLVIYLGAMLAPGLYALLAARYARVGVLEDRPAAAFLLLLPSILFYAAFLTNPAHHLFLTRSPPVGSTGGGPLVWAGPLYWVAAAWGFSIYLSYTPSYTVTYGTLAGVIITLMFFYLTGLTIIFGAEVNAALNQLGHAERG